MIQIVNHELCFYKPFLKHIPTHCLNYHKISQTVHALCKKLLIGMNTRLKKLQKVAQNTLVESKIPDEVDSFPSILNYFFRVPKSDSH